MRTFAVLEPGSPPVAWGNGRSAADRAVVFPTESMFQFISRPGFRGDTLSVREDTLRSTAEELGLPDPMDAMPRGQGFVAVNPERARALRGLLDAVHGSSASERDGPGPRDPEPEIVAQLLTMLSADPDGEISRPVPRWRDTVLQRALAYIEAHAHDAPTVLEVARASGTTLRTLQYAFRERLEMSPKKYLQVRRLEGVRRDLRSAAPGTTVIEIAAQWGFWHMGKFAAAYRARYGELPSKTLST